MTACSICVAIPAQAYAMQKHGREAEDTFLPAAGEKLKKVRAVKPGYTRYQDLMRCPECGTCYLFTCDTEYLATGSEDEQRLTRLSPEEAQSYLDGAP